jgi:ATP-binding cassette subfamily F protein uup
MDNEVIDWLENYLEGRKGALLMITHDRYFLDRVVNKTIELDNKQLYSYDGNYSLFIEKKIERQLLENALERKRLNLYRTELEWIKRGARARSTKQKARIQRFEALESSIVKTEDAKMNISVASSRLGNKIIEIKDVSKSFEDKVLIKDFNYIVLKNDRIGIVGNNGIGKSTLVNIITGKLLPDSGFIDIGSTVNIGYFSQESESMPLNLRAIEYIKETAEYMTTADGAYISAAQLMETFLFNGDMQWTPISRLSGGERRRLYLLKVLIDETNDLILDEPTNDLDIDTLKILESYIDEFQGAVITVSHVRYFLDRTCHKIFAFEGNGLITQYSGNYSDYLINKPEIEDPSTKSDKP